MTDAPDHRSWYERIASEQGGYRESWSSTKEGRSGEDAFEELLERFPTLADFAAFWSRMPGHPDYLRPEHRAALDELADAHRDGDGFAVPEWRFVWGGRRDS